MKRRWKWKVAAIVLSRARELFIARLVLRWVLMIVEYAFGGHPVTISPSGLILSWAINLFVFRWGRVGWYSGWAALLSFKFLLPGQSLFQGSLMDLTFSYICTWIGAQLEGRFLSAAEAAEFERLRFMVEFWSGLYRHVLLSLGTPAEVVEESVATFEAQSRGNVGA
jgi:hypothetical protein